jgi:hypothetical protein
VHRTSKARALSDGGHAASGPPPDSEDADTPRTHSAHVAKIIWDVQHVNTFMEQRQLGDQRSLGAIVMLSFPVKEPKMVTLDPWPELVEKGDTHVRSSSAVHCLVPHNDFVGVSRWLSDLHGLREQARLTGLHQRRKSQSAARPGKHKVKQTRGKTRKYEHDIDDDDCGALAGPVNPKRKRCSTGGAKGAWKRVRVSGC